MTNSPHDPFEAPGPAVTPAPSTSSTPPAGWYPDPGAPALMRWWDGSRWTEHQTAAGTTGADPVNATSGRRPKRHRIALVALGTIAALFVLSIVSSGVLQAVRGATGSAGDTEKLSVDVPTEWVTAPALKGAGAFAYDPTWEDATAVVGVAELEEFMAAEGGLEALVDGAWFINGDAYNGGTVLMVLSVAEAPGPSAARIEVQSYIGGATEGLEDSRTTQQGPVETKNGLSGYTAEFEYPFYDDVILNSVGIVIDGRRQVLVSTTGSLTTGAGTEQMEAVLNSLEIN